MISERFTLILGKIEKSDIISHENPSIQTCLKQLNSIAIENFIEALDLRIAEYAELKKSLSLPRYLKVYSQKSKLTSDIIIQLYSVFQNFKNLIQYNNLLTLKKKLIEELKISKIYEKVSNISTITELIEDLKENVKKNHIKLTYFEEDYLKHKNQIDSINRNISEYKNQIINLNKAKKAYFNEINKITRNMETTAEDKSKWNNKIDYNQKIPISEKIKQLQNNARETQHQINQLRAKIEEKKLNVSKLEPQFRVYEKDHKNITSLIQNDKSRITELEEKLKNEIKESNMLSGFNNQTINKFKFKSKKEIESKISLIEQKITQIEVSKDYYNPKNPQDLSKIQHKLLELTKKVKKKQKELQIVEEEKDIVLITKQFEMFENIIKKLESIVNLFLKEIKLKTQFFITINKVRENLYIEIVFTRNEKEKLKFENLTTPEKVFFVLIFSISIKILNNSKNIIFSNLFIPESYNKRGSIERTIKKIIPLFSTESRFSEIRLIFIISNLDIKSDINNLKLIKVEKS